jgi:hypothetical protein
MTFIETLTNIIIYYLNKKFKLRNFLTCFCEFLGVSLRYQPNVENGLKVL